jgi:hypothetical protein
MMSIRLYDYDSATGERVKDHTELTVRTQEGYGFAQWPPCRCPSHLRLDPETGETTGTELNLSGVALVRYVEPC